ncbi:MAG TPA: hypothetical protein VIF60_17880, partial [Burkholderiaceae bacterium]
FPPKRLTAIFISIGLAIGLAGCSGGGSGNHMPTVTFSSPASAMAINLGQSLTLTWASTDATSCTASASNSSAGNFSGPQATSGSVVVAPTATGSATYMLSCTGAGGTGSVTSAAVTVNPSILSSLSKIATIGSTLDPLENGGNPYGLAIAPVSSGSISAGDLVVCNFNDGATNTQGLGTTIVGLHPVAGAMPYRIAQSPQLLGCSAVAMLPDDSIAAAAFSSNLVPLVTSAGAVTNPFAANSFQGPWGQTYAPSMSGRPAALYVSSQTNGSIARITLSGDTQTGFVEIAKGFCGSGAPGGLFAPAGLTYDPSIDTLYIVDSSSYSVVAFANVSTIGAEGIVVNGNCSGTAHTPTPVPTFAGSSATSARVIASGGQFNGPISAALLMDGTLVVANGDLDGPPTNNLLIEISPAIGFVGAHIQLDNGAAAALFGLAAKVDSDGNQVIYFNDDNDNTVKVLSK